MRLFQKCMLERQGYCFTESMYDNISKISITFNVYKKKYIFKDFVGEILSKRVIRSSSDSTARIQFVFLSVNSIENYATYPRSVTRLTRKHHRNHAGNDEEKEEEKKTVLFFFSLEGIIIIV